MARNDHLLSVGNEALTPMTSAMSALTTQIDQLTEVADARSTARLATLKTKIENFTASVTLVGQVKAGKSSIVNILAGRPALLPSDVNPWTSVVTTLNINTRTEGDTRSKFTFFEQEEWDNLMIGGGRLGELANRAGADDEMDDIRRQINEMKDKSEERLGKHFDLILGQSHQYDYFDEELIQRYVCLGDEDDPDINPKTGRFADVTKSADLFMDIPQYPISLKLCDTPGVNDTFMVREQITLRSLRGSEVCIVVLAASQALTTMDMALMRIIAQFENRQIILFVNRIDELADPVNQVPEIRDRIQDTLKQNNIDANTSVVFGSALWAEAAITGNPDILTEESREALNTFYLAAGFGDQAPSLDKIWALSGLPDLLLAMNERIAEGAGNRLLERVRHRARNIASQIRATAVAKSLSNSDGIVRDLDGVSTEEAIAKITEQYEKKVAELTTSLRDKVIERLKSAESNFVKRATDSLISHLEQNGEEGTWQYDPAGLRTLQKAAYFSFARSMRKEAGSLYSTAASDVEALYQKLLGNHLGEFAIEAPIVPRVPPPLGIGRTIALDLQSTWWRRWWQRRKGFEAYAADYTRLIASEANSITKDIEENQVAAVLENVRAVLSDFLREQKETLLSISASAEAVPNPNAALLAGGAPQKSRDDILGDILKDLSNEAA
ncbi:MULTISPECIES: dynamin family protein [unclassified Ruegeria]|uniref:dynamin family protein n=1 Tax=unclassified Ruegeria TaxID=2625375 RepID=UPI001AD9627D|nr:MULTISPECIES: dynamin family protein [unclassified Ruegeria]MBO9412476.1 dynamin family protein [Ruegeria sp. R8_1]MBO9416286.1 dynamin family protein [Ruegeria sp. R8_2]